MVTIWDILLGHQLGGIFIVIYLCGTTNASDWKWSYSAFKENFPDNKPDILLMMTLGAFFVVPLIIVMQIVEFRRKRKIAKIAKQ